MVKRTNDKHRAAWNIGHEMADLLGWARHPSPEPLSLGWADAYKKNTVSTVDYALHVFESDESVCKKLKSARKLAFEFIALLAGNPTLAAIPVHEWNVQAYRQLFDDLSELKREFKILSHTAEAPATMEPTAATVPPTTKPIPKQGISLRSAAEILAHRGGEGIGTTNEILTKLRKFSHEFQKTGFARNMKSKPLFSVETMARLIMKCGYTDSEKSASQNLKSKLEDCRDS
jgi:hypothetical protein